MRHDKQKQKNTDKNKGNDYIDSNHQEVQNHFCGLRWGLDSTKNDPRWSCDAPKWSQHGAKMEQNEAQMALRWRIDDSRGLKMVSRSSRAALKVLPNAPKTLQDSPKRRQDGSKDPQDGLKMGQRDLKMAQRRPQEGS